MKRCATCRLDKDESEFSANRSKPDGLQVSCKACRKAQCASWYARNKEKQADANKTWRDANRGQFNAWVADKRARIAQAIPSWVDPEKVRAFYYEAGARTASGEPSHVDHIVPITSKLVCGLHWEGNMRVATQTENTSKGNRWWPDMP